MSLLQADRIIDTIIGWIEEQRPIYDTIIDMYHQGRRLNIFLGKRASITESSLPSIELYSINDSMGWFACRVQEANPNVGIDITTDNRDPENANRLQDALCTLTSRIILNPAHLVPQIEGTTTHLFDSLLSDCRYDQTAQKGAQKVATLSWNGKYIEYLVDRSFQEELRQQPPVEFPPY